VRDVYCDIILRRNVRTFYFSGIANLSLSPLKPVEILGFLRVMQMYEASLV